LPALYCYNLLLHITGVQRGRKVGQTLTDAGRDGEVRRLQATAAAEQRIFCELAQKIGNGA